MCAKWRNGYNPELILNTIAPLVSLGENGKLVSSSISYIYQLKPVLSSAIEFNPRIPDAEKDSIVTSAVREALGKHQLRPDALKQALNRAERAFLKKKETAFVFATTISLRNMPPFRKLTIDGQEIVFSKYLPKNFDRQDAEKRLARILSATLPTDYMAVRVASMGRTPAEGAEIASSALGMLLGIWNFILTRGSFSYSFGHASKGPIAGLRLGPLRTVHHLDGSMATQTMWYEPTYTGPAPNKDYSDKFGTLRKSERWILKQLSTSPDGNKLRKAFMRYGTAVDETRLETAYLELWGLLEQLTDTGKESYDKTIRRAACIYADPRVAREELQHLRDFRNSMVHLGQSSSDPQTCVYQLKKYVDDILFYLLRDENVTRSREELNEILDLPTDHAELKRRHALYRRAASFRAR